jgi:predicted ribosome quality control (RQC) complex YloA/Tae2 family protein
MTLLDLRAAVTELRGKLTGLRLANVYDVNSRTYLLKFSQPGKKFVLLVESGTRVHTTQFTRDKSAIPSGFSMKVRHTSRLLQQTPLVPASPLLTSVLSLAAVPASQAHSNAPP